MAYLAVNKDGTEVIGEGLQRAKQRITHIECNGNRMRTLDDQQSKDYFDEWADVIEMEETDYNAVIVLPKGTIQKLTGRKITWEDDPVELK